MGVRSLVAMLLITVGVVLLSSMVEPFRDFLPGLLSGAWVTVCIAALSALLAVGLAVIAALTRLYAVAPLRWLARAYIETFRGTSALVQLFWLFFVLPFFGVTLTPFTVAVLALGLNIGAYGAEVVRGSVQAVSRGQWEAATALNMTRVQMLRRIIMPQAVIAMIPPWGNLFIELLKSTALVSLITLADLAFQAQSMNQATFKTLDIFSLVLLIYLAISLAITIGMRTLEGAASRGLARGRGR
jgi:polar amino acid transport system permease protein